MQAAKTFLFNGLYIVLILYQATAKFMHQMGYVEKLLFVLKASHIPYDRTFVAVSVYLN